MIRGFPGPGRVAAVDKVAAPARYRPALGVLKAERDQVILGSFCFGAPNQGHRQKIAGGSRLRAVVTGQGQAIVGSHLVAAGGIVEVVGHQGVAELRRFAVTVGRHHSAGVPARAPKEGRRSVLRDSEPGPASPPRQNP